MTCPRCGQPYEIGCWPICQDPSGKHGHYMPNGSISPLGMHASERTVVYEHPGTGQIRYPGRADAPLPERYRQQGFVKRELRTLRDVDTFSKQHHVVNERAHCDGNGRGLDG